MRILVPPSVAMAAMPSGSGYWIVDSAGDVTTWGGHQLWIHDRSTAQRPHHPDRGHSRRQGLLAGGRGRRGLLFRRRSVLGLGGRCAPEWPCCGNGTHTHWEGLLAGSG